MLLARHRLLHPRFTVLRRRELLRLRGRVLRARLPMLWRAGGGCRGVLRPVCGLLLPRLPVLRGWLLCAGFSVLRARGRVLRPDGDQR